MQAALVPGFVCATRRTPTEISTLLVVTFFFSLGRRRQSTLRVSKRHFSLLLKTTRGVERDERGSGIALVVGSPI